MSIFASIPLPAEPVSGLVPDAVQHVEHDDARVVLTRDEQPVAAIVPLRDLRALEELDEAEDEHWSRVAEDATPRWNAEGQPACIPMEDIARDLGIDLTAAP